MDRILYDQPGDCFAPGLSTSPDAEGFRYMREAGFFLAETGRGKREEAEALDFSLIRRQADAEGIRLRSFHLPFLPYPDVDLSPLDNAKRQENVDGMKALIEKGASIGIGLFVLHTSGHPIEDGERERRIEQALISLSDLAAFADGCGARIAVEDLSRTCLGRCGDEMLRLLSADDRLGVCFDTNHLLYEDNFTFLKKVAGHIVTTHISDYDFVNQRHVMPGEGKIDWPALLAALRETGYRGPLIYEASRVSNAHITRRAPVSPAQLRENYLTLMAGKQPEPIDTEIHFL